MLSECPWVPATENSDSGFPGPTPGRMPNSSLLSAEPACPSHPRLSSTAPRLDGQGLPYLSQPTAQPHNQALHSMAPTLLLLPSIHSHPLSLPRLSPYVVSIDLCALPLPLLVQAPSFRCGPSNTFPVPFSTVTLSYGAKSCCSNLPSPLHVCLCCWGLCALSNSRRVISAQRAGLQCTAGGQQQRAV